MVLTKVTPKLPIILPLLAIVGARTQYTTFIYLMLILACTYVLLISFNKIKPSAFILFCISISLLWQTTLISNYLVGTDIHTEYFYYKLAEHGWNPQIPHNYNGALGITVLAPFLSYLFHIDGVWVFKVIYPLIFSLAPVMLYLTFKKIFPSSIQDQSSRLAFLSAFFFVTMPVFSLEVIGITKLQLAGFILSCLILLSVSTIGSTKKLLLGILLGCLLSVLYYTLGFFLILSIVVGLLILAIVRGSFGSISRLKLEGLTILAFTVSLTAILYYGWVSGGEPLKTMAYYGYANILGINPNVANPQIESPKSTESTPAKSNIIAPQKIKEAVISLANDSKSLIKSALGLDFFESSPLGKIFRILQFITEVLLLLGCLYIFLKRNELPDSFVAFSIVGCLVILAALLKPGFYTLLNPTRLYHITLYILSPLLVMGGLLILRKKTIPILGCILTAYFIFTSGFAFALTSPTSIETLDIPYSIALSSNKIDIAGIFTNEDKNASKWLVDRIGTKVVYGDLHGMLLLYEEVGLQGKVYNFPQDWNPKTLSEIPDKSFIFLRKWNVDNNKVTYWTNIGLRKSYTFEEVRFRSLIEGRELVYSEGAQIYGPRIPILIKYKGKEYRAFKGFTEMYIESLKETIKEREVEIVEIR